MSKQDRLRQRIESLRSPFQQLLEVLSQLQQARALSSDAIEQLRLDAAIKSKQAQRELIEREMDLLDSQLSAQPAAPLIFWSYAHEDEPLRDALAQQLATFSRPTPWRSWHDRCLLPGQDLDASTTAALAAAQLIIVLLSMDYLADARLMAEATTALGYQQAGKARVIPILLQPCPWEETPLGRVHILPKDAVPVSLWPDRVMILQELARAIKDALTLPGPSS